MSNFKPFHTKLHEAYGGMAVTIAGMYADPEEPAIMEIVITVDGEECMEMQVPVKSGNIPAAVNQFIDVGLNWNQRFQEERDEN